MKSATSFERACVLAFVIYGLLSACVMMWKLPPFMGPDEPNHLKRANLVANGSLVGQRFGEGSSVNSGGDTEVNLDKAVRIFDPVKFNSSNKVTPSELTAAKAVPWGPEIAPEGFSNTAVYPPAFYIPQSFAVLIGKVTGQSILSTLTLARLANALSCIVVGTFAVALAGRARFFLLCVLLLPMSVELFSRSSPKTGSSSPLSALACALIVRALGEGRPMTRNEIAGVAVCIGLVGLTKPPYALLAFILLFVSAGATKAVEFVAFGSALVPGVAWNAWMMATVQTPLLRKGADRACSARRTRSPFLLHHPAWRFQVSDSTMCERISASMWCRLSAIWAGSTPAFASALLRSVAYLVLAFAATYGFRGISRSGICILVVLAVVFAAVFAGLYVALYACWSSTVDGVQGRYFLPVLALLPAAIVGSKRDRPPAWLDKACVQQAAPGRCRHRVSSPMSVLCHGTSA